jgi:outer membrane immunogenic protein
MCRCLFASAGAFALLANGAFAADLSPPTRKAPPPPVFTWTGCYVGVHAGGDFGQSKWTDPTGTTDNFYAASAVAMNTARVIGGGQAGCNYQMSNSFVVGVEAEIWGSDLEGSRSIGFGAPIPQPIAQFKTWSDAAGDVALRAGYAIDRTLIFGKVGVAEAQYRYRLSFANAPLPAPETASATHTGLLLGLGVEYALDMHWSLKGEYDYIDYGSKSAEFYYQGIAEFPASFKNEENVLKVGANYRF